MRLYLHVQVCALTIFRHGAPKYVFGGRTRREISKIRSNIGEIFSAALAAARGAVVGGAVVVDKYGEGSEEYQP